MKKLYVKLAASVISIIMAMTMIVGATYAWLVLSKSPVIQGINVTIGGGRTIMLAPDITENIIDEQGNSVTVHYPGKFESALNFSDYEGYDYLKKLSGLSPVSTADGMYWLIPSYDEETGELKPVDQFKVDELLEYANVEKTIDGSYIYLDFWVVSPGTEYNLRVSMDTKKQIGSYLIELPNVEENESGTLQLAETAGIIESTARVGFLVNGDEADDSVINAYNESSDYNKEFNILQGVYQEKGNKLSGEYQFSIYEPNALKHPAEHLDDGDYVLTAPLRYNPYGNSIEAENIGNILMIQDGNTWVAAGEESLFKQIFKTSIANKGQLTTEEAKKVFYQDYLQGQIGAYVKSGQFFKRTDALYTSAADGIVRAENINVAKAGATDDVKITTLKKDTPQRIRMFLWLEGQDIDCVNSSSVDSSGFCLNLEFSGADQ